MRKSNRKTVHLPPAIRRKLTEIYDKAEWDMMGFDHEAEIARGRYCAAKQMLEGGKPEDIEYGLRVFPRNYPTLPGLQEVIDQFKGLI